ncbi:hypothetical protein BDA99DRAFT_532400 [Phascolomyces articulosus]|uniref:Uncharacterized protein n=1 Tax=Phascolomyces articulosus TaxID=60185 RepID=A0AAD5KL30_9FUNG|nr:hypothetical protein BDA99DRAFT_532400 [Phascolomyces articulosus]
MDVPVELLLNAAAFIQRRIEDAINVIPEICEFQEELVHLNSIIPQRLIKETIYVINNQKEGQPYGDDASEVRDSQASPPVDIQEATPGYRRHRLRKALAVLVGYDRGDDDEGDKSNVAENPKSWLFEQSVELRQLKPDQAIVWKILKKVSRATQRVTEFLENEKQADTSFRSGIPWYAAERPIYAKEIRAFCQSETNSLRLYLNDLVIHLQLEDLHKKKEKEKQQAAHFQDQMTEETYRFWETSFQNKICVDWQCFRDAYELLYGKLVFADAGFIKRVLVPKVNGKSGEHLTLYGFIGFTRQYGFPFSKDIFTKSTAAIEPEDISEEKRMKITKMTMDLVDHFSDPKMRNHLVSIYTWFRGCSKDNKEQMRNRADEWANIIKEKRAVTASKKKAETPLGTKYDQDDYDEAEAVDLARRAIYFFYEKFMVMWRVGGVTRDVLKNIDFPGRGRIKDFLNFVKPLDLANYYLLVKGFDKVPKDADHTPEIYKFMKKYLEILKSEDKERKTLEEETKKKNESNENADQNGGNDGNGSNSGDNHNSLLESPER